MNLDALFSIGEFSRMTGLTVKALRFYHEQNLLSPIHIDLETGYRYYAAHQAETARAVKLLRELEFPIKDILDILKSRADSEKITQALERQKAALETRVREHRKTIQALNEFIAAEKQGEIMSNETSQIQEKLVPALLVAGIRMKGKYNEIGPLFGKLCRGAKGAAKACPMTLYHDCEYKETDADFEACIPLKKQKEIPGASVRELPEAQCAILIHKDPYEELHNAYQVLFTYIKEKNHAIAGPIRELYIKGPGMIFRGNPKKYITEIQIPITKPQ